MADTMPQHKLVIIQESMLDGMATNDRFVREFPFIKGLALIPRSRCNSCGGGAFAAKRQQAYAAAKRQLASLPGDKKRILKELLNTKQARVIYKTDSGRLIELTF